MAKEKVIKDAKLVEEEKEEVVELEVEETEVVEETTQKTKKENVEKENKKVSKKEKKDKKEGYFAKVGRELKKVVWPSAGSVFKYTFAVLIFCVFLCLFFKGIELVAALLKELFV